MPLPNNAANTGTYYPLGNINPLQFTLVNTPFTYSPVVFGSYIFNTSGTARLNIPPAAYPSVGK